MFVYGEFVSVEQSGGQGVVDVFVQVVVVFFGFVFQVIDGNVDLVLGQGGGCCYWSGGRGCCCLSNGNRGDEEGGSEDSS